MDQPARPFTSDGGETRRWIGRLIIAVLLGEAIWGLIVSFMNHVFVPWLGDVMGQSSGLPTSFTQRPYNYPELFVSVFEFCIAGLVAAVINYFLQRPTARKIKTVRSPAPVTPVALLRTIPQEPPPPSPTPVAPPPVARPEPIAVVEPERVPPPQAPAALAPPPVARPAAVALPAPPVVSPAAQKPPAPKADPAKLKKPKEVYYNIVGEPMASDDD